MLGHNPVLAEIVLDRILTIVQTNARELQIHGVIRGLAVEDMNALSPHLRNDLIQQHVDMLDWWLTGSWRDELHRAEFVYGTPPAAPPLSVDGATVVVAGQEWQEPGGAPQQTRLSPRDSVDSVTGYDEQPDGM
ncbi:hypothetical protein [Leifsonia shinshuensis]|uniref:Uncharacterized protein n=1 Tax=Leifsonia shinshuensis TaxID=150026 RepID=A0A853CRC0_9MICO|nr:hypothetical protein [Leifsonia shinshuensis]NYJ23476.1 hypothetical protein [Leifsonia shinshuensis]